LSTTSTNYSFYKPEAGDNPPQAIVGIAGGIEKIDGEIKKVNDVLPKAILTTKGDIMYASDNNVPARLAKGTQGLILKQGAEVPEWGSLTANDIGALKKDSGADLPTADEAHRGQFFTKTGATTVADELYVCLKNATDAYEWKKIM
jgi:hypothetical protein